jgi:flagellar secretion chaperone FliS
MYAAARASNAYRQVDLNSAPKHEILSRLFERFLQDLDAGRKAIAAKDIVAKSKALDHALAIVNEFQASLDHAASPELCANLDRLYRFVTERITVASTKLDSKPLDEAGKVMSTLAASFREAMQKR